MSAEHFVLLTADSNNQIHIHTCGNVDSYLTSLTSLGETFVFQSLCPDSRFADSVKTTFLNKYHKHGGKHTLTTFTVSNQQSAFYILDDIYDEVGLRRFFNI